MTAARRSLHDASPLSAATNKGHETLTAYEVEGLSAPCNLADGHAKLRPIAQKLSRRHIAALAAVDPQGQEKHFLEIIGSFAGERFDQRGLVLFPSASLAIDTIAKFLAATGRRQVALLEPTFDNIALLLKRAGLGLTAVRESTTDIYEACLDHDALFLVSPNNPTGWHPEPPFWDALGEHLTATQTLLIVDRTFRFFLPVDAGLNELAATNPLVITIDDTGKTWSTLECKVSFAGTLRRSYLALIREIAEEIVLNVSPLSLELCIQTMRLERGATRISTSILQNQETMASALRDCGFQNYRGSLSFLLVQATATATGSGLVEDLLAEGVATLPLAKFYWNSGANPPNTVRMSLARPPETVAKAADILRRKFS